MTEELSRTIEGLFQLWYYSRDTTNTRLRLGRLINRYALQYKEQTGDYYFRSMKGGLSR